MKINNTLYCLLLALVFLTSCITSKNNLKQNTTSYKPDNQELYNSIARMDSIFWNAYNTCDMEMQSLIYSDSIEFYHDQGGLISSKQQILDATRMNICGKIRRDLVEGSLEVYPIRGYGAVEMGSHTFTQITEANSSPSRPGKFVIIWQLNNGQWTIKRVISLH